MKPKVFGSLKELATSSVAEELHEKEEALNEIYRQPRKPLTQEEIDDINESWERAHWSMCNDDNAPGGRNYSPYVRKTKPTI